MSETAHPARGGSPSSGAAWRSYPDLVDWVQAYRRHAGAGADLVGRALAAVVERDPGCGARLGALLEIVAHLAADPETTAAAILELDRVHHDDCIAGGEGAWPERIQAQLNALAQVRHYTAEAEAATRDRAENLRRLLLALAGDVRVVMVALAVRLLALREAADGDAESARRLAAETMQIHAPLANRLGIWQLKWELEDLSFRYLQPDEYERVSGLVAERRADREAFISSLIKRLEAVLAAAGVAAKVSGRPKHIYSIWRKMQRKGLDYHDLYDIRAVRVLVDEVADCYRALGVVHMHFTPVPGEFDDYITHPKPNGYQSLHTAVIGEAGQAVEVQIRTQAMHDEAELGVAAHWRYKEGGPDDEKFNNKIKALRQLLEADHDLQDDAGLLEQFAGLTSEERVYVLTPRGEVIDLPAGATALDFAYQIHTLIGHRCRGAKVNGRIVPLNRPLLTGERVEILTAREPRPSRDWLNPRLGYLKSGRARNKIRQWFRQADWSAHLAAGRQWLDEELKRLNQRDPDLAALAAQFNLPGADELYVALGAGDLTVQQVSGAVLRSAQPPPPATLLPRPPARPPASKVADEIQVAGTGGLLHHLARCCQPVPGDAICGYITRGRGISVHRADCATLARLAGADRARLLDVDWGAKTRSDYTVEIRVRAEESEAVLKEISGVLQNAGAGIAALPRQQTAAGILDLHLAIRVGGQDQLRTVLDKLQSLPAVIDARRAG